MSCCCPSVLADHGYVSYNAGMFAIDMVYLQLVDVDPCCHQPAPAVVAIPPRVLVLAFIDKGAPAVEYLQVEIPGVLYRRQEYVVITTGGSYPSRGAVRVWCKGIGGGNGTSFFHG